MKLSVGLKQRTSLSLTPQLQQAIRLLQLSSVELAQEIQAQLDSNPLLDLEDSESSSPETDFANNSNNSDTDTAEATFDQSFDQQQVTEQMAAAQMGEDLPVDANWDDVYSAPTNQEYNPDLEDREDQSTAATSLADHLAWQLEVSQFSPIDHFIALFIVDAIDERGFLITPLEDLLLPLQQQLESMDIDYEVEQDELEVVLKRIQNFDPIGVGARNIEECLSLQLEAMPVDTLDLAEAKILLKHHQYLLQHDITGLIKQTGLSRNALTAAMSLLKSLNSAPGSKFADASKDYQTPDVVVKRTQTKWSVFLNPDVLPRLRVHPYYASLLDKKASATTTSHREQHADSNHFSGTEERAYLNQHLQDARQFIKSVDERHKTLLRVATCIVTHQKAFFELGVEAMKPLVLREIAEELELHESTISRVTTQKYMLTPRGLFELKYFFSSHVATSTGGECSSTAIRAMVKNMIDNENPKKPLSDQIIADQLQQAGIDVARRTIAKYRESLNIASSSERKHLL